MEWIGVKKSGGEKNPAGGGKRRVAFGGKMVGEYVQVVE